MQNDPKFVGDSNSTLKFLTFQLSNVRELETNKYAFVKNWVAEIKVCVLIGWLQKEVIIAVYMYSMLQIK